MTMIPDYKPLGASKPPRSTSSRYSVGSAKQQRKALRASVQSTSGAPQPGVPAGSPVDRRSSVGDAADVYADDAFQGVSVPDIDESGSKDTPAFE